MNRSNAATYSGLWSTLRTLFVATQEAQIRGLNAAQFSLNQPGGRCEACKGTGTRRVDLDLLADVFLECPVCNGRRFSGDLLEVRWKGHNAAEILALPASEALVLLAGHPKLENALRCLVDVGLGYLPLGQPARTLSGGEAHRLRLAKELSRARRGGIEGTVYLLDDPTRGLHPADVEVLIGVFRKLVDAGGTLWLATQDPAVVAAADSAILLS
ncbi:MAG: hypothetical protein GWP91_18385 [Rhodobacterales bacterium]|nr:hypothetical protein [Rhodobacterales bacterium]